MSEYRPGDRLRIVLDDVQVQAPVENGYLTVNVGCDEIRIGLDEAGVTVERKVPTIEPGDLWRDKDGLLWFAVESLRSETDHGPVLLTCNGRNRRPISEIHELYSPLTLVHREDDGEVSGP